MTENEFKREATFEEEYEILQEEKEELFAMEICDTEPPFANCVVRRALRCIRKLLEEVNAYRAIGTPTQIYEKIGGLDIELGKYHSIGTIDEFKALKEKNEPNKVIVKGVMGFDGEEAYCCPTCGLDNAQWGCNRCVDCGQKLDWGE